MEVKDIILESALKVWLYRRPLLRALAVPLAIYLLLVIASEFNTSEAAIWLFIGIQLAIHTLIAVVTHRMMLIGPGSVPELAPPQWGRREMLFLGYAILLSVASLPIQAMGLAIPFVGPVVALVLMCFLFARLSLVFPGTAIEHEITLRRSWEATAPYQWQMLAVVIAYPLLFGALELLLSLVPGMEYAVLVLSVFTNVLTISALSIAYQKIVLRMDEAETAD